MNFSDRLEMWLDKEQYEEPIRGMIRSKAIELQEKEDDRESRTLP